MCWWSDDDGDDGGGGGAIGYGYAPVTEFLIGEIDWMNESVLRCSRR